MNFDEPAPFSPATFSHSLLQWYKQNARLLPWRETHDPYAIWVSEIMLQQTRVETAIPYFTRFLHALPTLEALAQAPEEQLLKLWEGLGYYQRVRNLQKAARIVCEQHRGILPHHFVDLQKLPGIGSYTAGSIASIAYGEPVPAVDGNVLRVMARLWDSWNNVSLPTTQKMVRSLVASLLPEKTPGGFNQALMELGATICLPNQAVRCKICPLKTLCQGYQQGEAAELPVKTQKKPRRIEQKTFLLLLTPQEVLITQRPTTGLLAGLWEYPHLDGWATPSAVRQQLKAWGISTPYFMAQLPPARHCFTHLEWHMHAYLVKLPRIALPPSLQWVAFADLHQQYPLPSAVQSYTIRLEEWACP